MECCPPRITNINIFIRAAVTTYKRHLESGVLTFQTRRKEWGGPVDSHLRFQPLFFVHLCQLHMILPQLHVAPWSPRVLECTETGRLTAESSLPMHRQGRLHPFWSRLPS